MLSADQSLWQSPKSRRRMASSAVAHAAQRRTVAVQLAGSDPHQLAEAARHQVGEGADIIDLNLGCPAKKVCDRLCGSALLGDEALVARIFEALVRAVGVPVTVKIRTGTDPTRRNATRIAQLAERAGVAAIAVHGRTRADRFIGHAEYETIRAVKHAVRIPVIANGDVGTPAQAQRCSRPPGADAVMIGRAALGSPWIFRDVNSFLRDGKKFPATLARVDHSDHPSTPRLPVRVLRRVHRGSDGTKTPEPILRPAARDASSARRTHGGGRFRVAVRAWPGACLRIWDRRLQTCEELQR